MKIEDVKSVARRTGRAELDEHAEGVNVTELFLEIADDADREETIRKIRETMEDIPGVVSSTEQPLAHLISHMISGVKAQIGIKLFGDDLDVLRAEQGRRDEAADRGCSRTYRHCDRTTDQHSATAH